jgi:hypothetical protein
LEDKKLELEEEKLLLADRRESEKFELGLEGIRMNERKRKGTLLIALVKAGKTEEDIANLLKHI